MTSKMTAIRIPEEKLALIDQNAAAADMSRTQWMIEAALNYQRTDDTDELDDIRRRLGRLEGMAGL